MLQQHTCVRIALHAVSAVTDVDARGVQPTIVKPSDLECRARITCGIDGGSTLDYAAQRYIEQGILVIVFIALAATDVDVHVLSICTVGLELILSGLPHLEFICFFAVGTYGGEGRIIKLATSTIPA